VLTVRASDEAWLSAPNGRPQFAIVCDRRHGEQTLAFEKREGTWHDPRRDPRAVSPRGITLAGALLDRDLARVKWLVGRHGFLLWRFFPSLRIRKDDDRGFCR
jgi:hypothetical protein